MKKKTAWIAVGAAAAALAVGGASVAVAGDEPSGDDQHLQGKDLRQASDAALAEVGPGTVTKAETSDDSNSAYEVDVRLDNGTAYDINLNESFGVVRVETEDDDDGGDRDDGDDNPAQPLTEAERTGTSEAALAEVGAGTVAKVERDDDGNSTFEVEIILDDGAEVDVELGPEFQILEVDAPEYDD
ncbi:PepSY domain-containing protein [Arthrobacter sp. H5]|uniref:PepSY domain-containing protein n=1 Tax=Arthrobacter sp. H5 TaxID=1267973 RepID=UPI00048740BB|nr:PepSY domain-containing protein [Arthrobacter sp. H5]